MKNIAFVLPGHGKNPTGGFKIVYEYANRFAADGYNVSIFYTIRPDSKNFIKNVYRLLVYILFKNFSCRNWFNLDFSIKEKLFFYSKNDIYHFSNICVTSVQTAYILNELNLPRNYNILYLIQDYEKWNGVSDEYILNSYKFPFKKIVISDWLKKKVTLTGEDASLIYNGFDFQYFKMEKRIEERNPYHICMLFHKDERKRCIDAINALEKVKKIYPELLVNIFGVPKRPKTLPEWYIYTQNPDKEKHNFIYNDSSIFIAASEKEGFGLPPAEAMICGCALACTNNDGFSTYAKNNETALTSAVYDVDSLANNIIKLISNNELRIRIAKNGNKFLQSFTWDIAFEKFRTIIENT